MHVKKLLLILACVMALAVSIASAAPVVVIPGESAGYIYYSAGGGGAPATPVADTSFVGMIAAFSTTPPADKWVVCNGQTISAAAYPELVEFLAGSAAASAVMPDYRGYFLRGANPTMAGLDPSRTVGSTQGDAIRNITGSFGAGFYSEYAAGGAAGAFARMAAAQPTKFTGELWTLNGIGLDFDASRVVPTASENRPHNKAVIYAMRAK